jgi:hypothetical protein
MEILPSLEKLKCACGNDRFRPVGIGKTGGKYILYECLDCGHRYEVRGQVQAKPEVVVFCKPSLVSEHCSKRREEGK